MKFRLKKILAAPFIAIWVIILVVFALIFKLLTLPFPNRHLDALNKHIKDWQSRKKYIYLGFSSNFPLADFARNKLLKQYADFVIFDEWNEKADKWLTNEPDKYNRVTTIWQDVVGDYDGIPMLILFTSSPSNSELTKNGSNLHVFTEADEGHFSYGAEEPTQREAEKLIVSEIEKTLAEWQN